MDIKQRIEEVEQKFDNLSKQKIEIDTELAKLQGEWRLLNDMLNEKPKNKNAAVIDVVPEEKK